jgi:hypothetical protein
VNLKPDLKTVRTECLELQETLRSYKRDVADRRKAVSATVASLTRRWIESAPHPIDQTRQYSALLRDVTSGVASLSRVVFENLRENNATTLELLEPNRLDASLKIAYAVRIRDNLRSDIDVLLPQMRDLLDMIESRTRKFEAFIDSAPSPTRAHPTLDDGNDRQVVNSETSLGVDDLVDQSLGL